MTDRHQELYKYLNHRFIYDITDEELDEIESIVMRNAWRDISIDTNDGRLLVFSPCYPIEHNMRVRIVDSRFLKTLTDVTKWMPIPKDIKP